MKAKYQTVDVRRSELSTIRVTVPQWELPLLQALHTQVEPVSQPEIEIEEAPDARSEFQRLSDRYGVEIHDDGGRGDPMVEAVYGKHAVGISQLQRAIDAAVAD